MSFRHRKQYKIKYSQNFLRDRAAISLINKMQLKLEDVVVEIGPGTGQLTKHLLERVRFVLAVEKDPVLSKKLSQEFRNYQNFVCINADFLTWELPLTNFKVVGNIPFAHTHEIVRKLVTHQSPPQESYLVMQHEACCDFTGKPRETLFSLLTKPSFEFELVCRIRKGEFIPQPSVDAGLLKITRQSQTVIPTPLLSRYKEFIEQIMHGFDSNVHKSLNRVVGRHLTKSLAGELTIDLSKRRTDIKFEEWVAIFRHLNG